MCELLVDRRTHPASEGADRHHIYVLTPSNGGGRRDLQGAPVSGPFVASVFNLHATDVLTSF